MVDSLLNREKIELLYSIVEVAGSSHDRCLDVKYGDNVREKRKKKQKRGAVP